MLAADLADLVWGYGAGREARRRVRADAVLVRARAVLLHRALPDAPRLLRARAQPAGVLHPVRRRRDEHPRSPSRSPAGAPLAADRPPPGGRLLRGVRRGRRAVCLLLSRRVGGLAARVQLRFAVRLALAVAGVPVAWRRGPGHPLVRGPLLRRVLGGAATRPPAAGQPVAGAGGRGCSPTYCSPGCCACGGDRGDRAGHRSRFGRPPSARAGAYDGAGSAPAAEGGTCTQPWVPAPSSLVATSSRTCSPTTTVPGSGGPPTRCSRAASRSTPCHSDDARAPGVLDAARLSATVTDPHFLRVLDCDDAGGLTWVINEWGEGLSLRRDARAAHAAPGPRGLAGAGGRRGDRREPRPGACTTAG